MEPHPLQLDIFGRMPGAEMPPKHAVPSVDLKSVMAGIRTQSRRPRMAFHLLTLLASISREDGRIGAEVLQPEGARVPLRQHLAELLLELTALDPETARPSALRDKRMAQDHSKTRADLLASRLTIVSREMNALSRAGLVELVYQGFRVNARHPGGRRLADYRIRPELRASLKVPAVRR